MIKNILKEFTYYMVILVVLALMQHQDLLEHPLVRFEHMQENGNFLHPFIWSFGVYLIIGIFRLVIKGVLKLKNRR